MFPGKLRKLLPNLSSITGHQQWGKVHKENKEKGATKIDGFADQAAFHYYIKTRFFIPLLHSLKKISALTLLLGS